MPLTSNTVLKQNFRLSCSLEGGRLYQLLHKSALLHEVHFAVKFSGGGELDCKVHQVQFQPNVHDETAKYTEPSLQGEVVLARL